MADSILLLLLLVAPLAVSLLLTVLPEEESILPRLVSMAAMLGLLAISAALFAGYDGTTVIACNRVWIPALGVNLHLAVDGLNVYLVLLTGLLFPVVLSCSWNTAPAKTRLFLGLMLLMEACLFGTFLSQNLMLFFVFWEAVLVPMFLLILVYGGDQRRRAAMTFFMYTLVGSVLLLAAVILLGVVSLQQTGRWSFEFADLYRLQTSWEVQLFVFVAVVLACLIKCPVFPFHSWLPLAYCEAPAPATALMSGVMSKMGAFGLLKLALPLSPLVAKAASPCLSLVAVFSILYGAVLALKQQEYKRLIAYSSLSHMGYIVLGIFSFQQAAVHGALFQILSHGVAVAGLFLLLDLLEQRAGTAYRTMNALSTRAPRLAVLTLLLVLTSVALPLTSGFTSEFLILFGSFQQALNLFNAGSGVMLLAAVLLASTGMVLGAGYMLRFARTLLYGVSSDSGSCSDLNLREAAAFAPLLVLIAVIGVCPGGMMEKARADVCKLANPDCCVKTTAAPCPQSAQIKPDCCNKPAVPAPQTTPTNPLPGGSNGQ